MLECISSEYHYITVITQWSTEVQQNKIKRGGEYSVTRESKKDTGTVLL